ncbi:MAG TPA: hypothetical protein VFS21_04130 [Roseiflexaceae bacterium]|nr:hypothetical protein [Roseiflexaceae bacterium]
MNKDTIINTIGPEVYARESAAAHERAPSTGQSFTPPAVNYDFFYAVNNLIWEDSAALARPDHENMVLAFAIYRDLPAYTLLMEISLGFEARSEAAKAVFWGQMRTHLAGESEALAQPLCYTLWCDYFEHPDRVERAWRELLVEPNDRLLRRVLDVSGPVPFPLKAALYRQLLPDKRWHADILASLYFSCVDFFGQVDKEAARELLGMLEVDGQEERIQQVRNCLG